MFFTSNKSSCIKTINIQENVYRWKLWPKALNRLRPPAFLSSCDSRALCEGLPAWRWWLLGANPDQSPLRQESLARRVTSNVARIHLMSVNEFLYSKGQRYSVIALITSWNNNKHLWVAIRTTTHDSFLSSGTHFSRSFLPEKTTKVMELFSYSYWLGTRDEWKRKIRERPVAIN